MYSYLGDGNSVSLALVVERSVEVFEDKGFSASQKTQDPQRLRHVCSWDDVRLKAHRVSSYFIC
jgi:hypothetical protein